jgi:ubiquinone/menaquinone biosynthesis C-methylase UbiE
VSESVDGQGARASESVRRREEARASYDRMSRWYDLVTGPFERRYREAGLRLLAPQQGERILEIGFGTGHGIVALARAVGDSGRVYGVDLSPGMCRVAWRRVQAAELGRRVTLICGNALRLPFTPGSFDAVLMSFTLELFATPEMPVVLREVQRVLRPGGRLGVVAMASRRRPGLMVRLYGWMHRTFPAYVDCRPIPVREVLAEAGFRLRESEDLSMGGLPVAAVVAEKA